MYRLHPAIYNRNIRNAAVVRGLTPAAWFRYGQGITVTGAGVSQWDDQSGNARHLKQGTDTNRPALQADNSILFDGVDNYLKCDAFTLNQPETVYLLAKQVTWTQTDRIFDGNTVNTGVLYQDVVTPRIYLFAGSAAAANPDLAVDTYGAVCAIFNGASSLIQVNNGTAITGDAGASNMGGLTLGASGTPDAYGNIQVKEVIVFAAAHDAGQRAAVIAYLRSVGGI